MPIITIDYTSLSDVTRQIGTNLDNPPETPSVIVVWSASLFTPPEITFDNGDIYILNGNGTGAWAGFVAGDMVQYSAKYNNWHYYGVPEAPSAAGA